MMSQVEFESYCKGHAARWYNTMMIVKGDDSGKEVAAEDVFMTWFSKTAGQMKGLFGLSIIGDNHYFEFTYISDDFIVMDVYDRVGKTNLYPKIMEAAAKVTSTNVYDGSCDILSEA